MRATLLVAAAFVLAAAAVLLPTASAQQSAALTVLLEPTQDPLREGESITLPGTVTLTADLTAYTSVNGIPVQYVITGAPAWATVVVTPASDVFTLPPAPVGTSVSVTRPILLTITVADGPTESVADLVEVSAVTTPSMFSRSFEGRGQAVVSYAAPEPAEDCDALTAEQRALLVQQASEVYNDYQEAQAADAGRGDEVTTQSAGATPLGASWVWVGAFGLVGAGVGLLLKRRLGR